MPEYACEPGFGFTNGPLTFTPEDKYKDGTFACFQQLTYDMWGYWSAGQTAVKCCGVLAETSSEAEEKPLSFYLAVASLVYCVVLTIVFAVWASRHPRNVAVMRRAPTRPPPQVVIQDQV